MATSSPSSSGSSGAAGTGSPGPSGFTPSSSTSKPKKDAIIIGIDFGTTYSGVAWCYTGLGDRNKIKTVRTWPSNPKCLEKVPTVLQYSAKDTSKYKWGFEVSTEASNPLKWFKLLLNQGDLHNNILSGTPPPPSPNEQNPRVNSAMNASDDDLQQLVELFDTLNTLPTEKSAEDLATDYLKALYKHTRARFNKEYVPSFASRIGTDIPLQFVLTVPAVWSDSAKALTLKAARAAGMDESFAEIKLVSEPEAAAIHCLKSFKDTEDSLQVGDVYVLADCGGGTIDLISYEIIAVHPSLRVKECVIGTGGLYGSTSLNRRFENLVKNRIGESEWTNMSAIARSNTMRHFDEYLKPTFCPPEFNDSFDDEDDLDELASYNCPLPGVADNRDKAIYKGHLLLTLDEMRTVFQPTFNAITKLVQEQVLAAEQKTRKPVTGVLLVGGFGSSQYLYKHLCATLKSTGAEPVKVLQPADAWSSITRGAVDFGLSLWNDDPSDDTSGCTVTSRIARFSYGVCAAEKFIPGYHPSSKMVFNRLSGDFYCPGRMQWFVKMGEEIPESLAISVPFLRRCPASTEKKDLVFTEEILCSDQPGSPPVDVEHPGITHLLLFTANFSDVSRRKHFLRRNAYHGGEGYWEIRFNMLMKYESASLQFSVQVADQFVGKGTVQYLHEAPKGKAKDIYGVHGDGNDTRGNGGSGNSGGGGAGEGEATGPSTGASTRSAMGAEATGV